MIILLHLLLMFFMMLAWAFSMLLFTVAGRFVLINEKEAQNYFFTGALIQLVLMLLLIGVF